MTGSPDNQRASIFPLPLPAFDSAMFTHALNIGAKGQPCAGKTRPPPRSLLYLNRNRIARTLLTARVHGFLRATALCGLHQ